MIQSRKSIPCCASFTLSPAIDSNCLKDQLDFGPGGGGLFFDILRHDLASEATVIW